MPSVSPLFAGDYEVTEPEALLLPTKGTACIQAVLSAPWRPCEAVVESTLADLDLESAAFVFLTRSEETSGSGYGVYVAGQEWTASEFKILTPLTAPEATFRHSHWAARRNRVYQLLSKPGIATANRLESFSHCGSSAIAEFSPSADRFRVKASYCHDRFCEPCMRARAGRIAAVLRTRAAGKHLRFLTLTLKHTREALQVQVDRLRTNFATLRHRKAWKEHVVGGAVTMEVKLSKNAEWHPHLHMILEGSWWDAAEISALWKAITGDSYIVKIIDCGTDPEQSGNSIGYVCSYITKPAKAGSIWENEQRFLEMMGALKGRRMVDLLGDWRGWVKEDDDQYVNPTDWKRIGSIDDIWSAAKLGEGWALCILSKLNRRMFRSPGVEESEPSLFSG